MNRKTFGKGLRFVAIFALMSAVIWGKAPRERVGLTISVYNEATVPEGVLSRGEEEAARVFREAGIEANWLNCRVPAPNEEGSPACQEVIYPVHLHLRIVSKPVGVSGETMGMAFQTEDGSGCFADLFYVPMEQLKRSDGTDIASLLGHVAAHEIGHLLLGTNSHAVAGIMHAHWTTEELAHANVGRLVFMDKESRRMQERLLNARRLSNEASLVAAKRIDD